MNKFLYRAKIKEVRDIAKDPNGPTGQYDNGKTWATNSGGAGFFHLKLKGTKKTIKLVIKLEDLYVEGFVNDHGPFSFTGATWNNQATNMGFTSDYAGMGWDRNGFHDPITFTGLTDAIDKVSGCGTKAQWQDEKKSIVKLIIAFIEGARMYAVQKCIEDGTRIGSVKWNDVNEPAIKKR